MSSFTAIYLYQNQKKIELDLFNYGTKCDLKNTTDDDTL